MEKAEQDNNPSLSAIPFTMPPVSCIEEGGKSMLKR
jgi:hypothetical protein